MAKDDAEARPACNVVSLDLHHDDITVLIVRAYGKWLYAEANPVWIKNEALKHTYLKLAKAAQHEQGSGTKEAQEDVSAGDNDTQENTEYEDEATPDTGKDSGYHSDSDAETEDSAGKDEQGGSDAEGEIRDFLLASLHNVIAEAAPKGTAADSLTLSQWYNGNILFFTLGSSLNDKDLLRPVQRDDLDGAKYITKNLTPHISLPKYLRKISGIPWYSPDDIEVVSEADDLHLSIHPTIVRTETSQDETHGQKFFLKLASEGDEHSVKRELKFLHTLAKDDLYSKGIRAPRLAGLVSVPSSPSSRTQALGFLLTLIPQPVKPLTEYMSTSVSQSKRNTWAKEAERMVKILHDNGLVWGDTKADNFLVDKDGLLWMIDFGGSYTEGWIREDLADTEEGDNMGAEKIIAALEDPEANVAEEDEEEKVAENKHDATRIEADNVEKKRGREEDEDLKEDGKQGDKRQRRA